MNKPYYAQDWSDDTQSVYSTTTWCFIGRFVRDLESATGIRWSGEIAPSGRFYAEPQLHELEEN